MANIMRIGGGSGGGASYCNLSTFASYFNRNTTTTSVTQISTTEVSLGFTIQSSTGYELASFSVDLLAGLYVAEIYATCSTNTGLNTAYMWGIYTSDTTTGAQLNDNKPMDNANFSSYVPFDRSDTAQHYYEVPLKVRSDGTAYVCFGVAADNNQNATITVSSLKIRKI